MSRNNNENTVKKPQIWLGRIFAAGFLFFFIKGLVWLALGGLAWFGVMGSK